MELAGTGRSEMIFHDHGGQEGSGFAENVAEEEFFIRMQRQRVPAGAVAPIDSSGPTVESIGIGERTAEAEYGSFGDLAVGNFLDDRRCVGRGGERADAGPCSDLRSTVRLNFPEIGRAGTKRSFE